MTQLPQIPAPEVTLPKMPAPEITILTEYGAHASLGERAGHWLRRLWENATLALATLAVAMYVLALVAVVLGLLIAVLLALPTLLSVPVGLAAALAGAHLARRWRKEYTLHTRATQAASALSARRAPPATPPREPARQTPQRLPPLAAGLRCPLCRADFLCAEEVTACLRCATHFHAECRAELHRCSTLGCGSVVATRSFRVVDTASALPPARARLQLGLSARVASNPSESSLAAELATPRTATPQPGPSEFATPQPGAFAPRREGLSDSDVRLAPDSGVRWLAGSHPPRLSA